MDININSVYWPINKVYDFVSEHYKKCCLLIFLRYGTNKI